MARRQNGRPLWLPTKEEFILSTAVISTSCSCLLPAATPGSCCHCGWCCVCSNVRTGAPVPRAAPDAAAVHCLQHNLPLNLALRCRWCTGTQQQSCQQLHTRTGERADIEALLGGLPRRGRDEGWGEEGEGTFTESGRESSRRLTEEKGKVFYRTASLPPPSPPLLPHALLQPLPRCLPPLAARLPLPPPSPVPCPRPRPGAPGSGRGAVWGGFPRREEPPP